MSNQENNKLITEFMGLAPNECGVYQTKRGPYHLENLSYHISWSWLMDVVEKIESFEDDNRCCKYNVKIEQCWVEIIDNQTSDEIIMKINDDKRRAVYEAVVAFINWYNKNK
tara:strand:+ start:501 stop:836 length:336 start_codon:yes stop_codon:yes gene_type:complete